MKTTISKMNNTRLYKIFFALPGIILILTSCDPNRVFDKYEEIPEAGWHAGKPVVFNVPVMDTMSLHNLFINVRHSTGYPFRNLFLFITTTGPDGLKTKDTLECILADEKGEYLGSGIGDLWDIQVPMNSNVKFSRSGNYVFEIAHGMRLDNLPLILEIGLRIERQNIKIPD